MTVTIAGTGHRPQKVCSWNDYELALSRATSLAESFLDRQSDIDFVISGMALFWDTAIALAAINRGLPLIAAVPFKGQESKWGQRDRDRYHRILSHATEVVYVCEPGYAAWKMQKRNEWMVDRADLMVALWDGTAGGTGNCIKYTECRGVAIVNLWDSWVKYSGVQSR